MGNFAKFHPPRINITGKALPKREETFKLIGIRAPLDLGFGQIVNDVDEAVGGAAGKAGDAADKAGAALDDAKKKGQQAVKDIEQKAGKLVDEIGDKIEDLEQIVKKIFEKVLGEIEDELNKWLQSVAKALAQLDIGQRYSLHVTTYCKVPRVPSIAKDGTFNSTAGPANCTQFLGGCE